MQNFDAESAILLIVAILLTALLLYLATRLVTGTKNTETGYLLKLLISAIFVWALIIVVGAILSQLGSLGTVAGLQQATTVIIFTGSIYIVKILIMPTAAGRYDVWERSIWITLLTFIFIYAVNYISGQLGTELIYFF